MENLQNNIIDTLSKVNQRTFKVYGKEITTKDGNKFVVLSTAYNEEFYKFKFKKACTSNIQLKGVYDVVVDLNDISVQRGKIKTKEDGTEFKENATIWVDKVISIRKYSDEELKAEQLNKNFELFK